jgi:hypothetical protein
MVEESLMLIAPALSVLILLLGVLGVLNDDAATRSVIWIGVAQLVGWGVGYARRQGWAWHISALAGAINGVFGLIIVVLEAALH